MSDPQHNTTPKKPPRWAKGFLTALAETGNIRAACSAAKIQRSTAYDLRKSSTAFAEAWDLALEQAADLLEAEARRRANEGVPRLKFHKGKAVLVPKIGDDGQIVKNASGEIEWVPYVDHEYSDSLLMFLLKGAKPETYRERSDVKHTFDPVDWERVPPDVRDAFIDGKIKLEDVQHIIRTTGA